jgi:hypothetical protein
MKNRWKATGLSGRKAPTIGAKHKRPHKVTGRQPAARKQEAERAAIQRERRIERLEAKHIQHEVETNRRLDEVLADARRYGDGVTGLSDREAAQLSSPESKWGWAGWGAAPELLDVELETRLSESCRSKVLDLSGLSLEQVPAAVISFPMLHTLQEVNLSYNQLTYLSEAFVAQCAQLETLRLEHNRIRALPVNMHHLRQLRVLNLEHNELQSLGVGLSQLPVLDRALVSGNNGITSLPPNLHYAGDGVVVVRRRPEVENEQREWAAMTIQVCWREWQWYLLMDEMHRKVHLERIQKMRERRRQPGHHVHFVTQRLPRPTLHSLSGSALLSPASEAQLANLEAEFGVGTTHSPGKPHRLRLVAGEEEEERERRHILEMQKQARTMIELQVSNANEAAAKKQRRRQETEVEAAVALQCFCRAIEARGVVSTARKGTLLDTERRVMEGAATRIQARQRGRCALEIAERRKSAAVVVGKGARGAVSRRRVEVMRGERRGKERRRQLAVTAVQCAERQRQAILEAGRRRAVKTKRAEEAVRAEDGMLQRQQMIHADAATFIQRIARGRSARRACRVERARRRQRQRERAKCLAKEAAKAKEVARQQERQRERQQLVPPSSTSARPRNVVGGAGAMVLRRQSTGKTSTQMHRIDIGGGRDGISGPGKQARTSRRRVSVSSAADCNPKVQKGPMVANTVDKLRKFHAAKAQQALQ